MHGSATHTNLVFLLLLLVLVLALATGLALLALLVLLPLLLLGLPTRLGLQLLGHLSCQRLALRAGLGLFIILAPVHIVATHILLDALELALHALDGVPLHGLLLPAPAPLHVGTSAQGEEQQRQHDDQQHWQGRHILPHVGVAPNLVRRVIVAGRVDGPHVEPIRAAVRPLQKIDGRLLARPIPFQRLLVVVVEAVLKQAPGLVARVHKHGVARAVRWLAGDERARLVLVAVPHVLAEIVVGVVASEDVHLVVQHGGSDVALRHGRPPAHHIHVVTIELAGLCTEQAHSRHENPMRGPRRAGTGKRTPSQPSDTKLAASSSSWVTPEVHSSAAASPSTMWTSSKNSPS